MTTITVLDGGFSTQLTHYVGDVIDGDPLWSARFLKTNPEAVVKCHYDFLRAGAEIIITNSYQASISGFMKYLGCDESSSYNLIKESVRLAKTARDLYLETNPNAVKPLIAGSIGPFGASLHDGSEYTGSYLKTVSKETICSWHRPRMEALIEEGVDLLAIETIPALEEAEYLLELLKAFPGQKAWLSFQCKDPEHTAGGDDFQKAVKKCWSISNEQLIAIGCNCVNPSHVSGLFEGLNNGLADKIPLITYPNSGEEYAADKGCDEESKWFGNKKVVNLTDLVGEWFDLGVMYVGGCCRTDATHVARLRKLVDERINKK